MASSAGFYHKPALIYVKNRVIILMIHVYWVDIRDYAEITAAVSRQQLSKNRSYQIFLDQHPVVR
jgi:hypothetical protein